MAKGKKKDSEKSITKELEKNLETSSNLNDDKKDEESSTKDDLVGNNLSSMNNHGLEDDELESDDGDDVDKISLLKDAINVFVKEVDGLYIGGPAQQALDNIKDSL